MPEGLTKVNPAKNLDQHARDLLEAKASPIFVSIGSEDDFKKFKKAYPKDPNNIDNDFGLGNLQEVSWLTGKAYREDGSEESLSAGPQTYVISGIDNSNKFSKGFCPCTGLIVAGITPSGKKISFLTHQSPGINYFIKGHRLKFIQDLEQQLRKIKEQSVLGTIDAVIIGGRYVGLFGRKEYLDTVELLGKEIEKVLGFDPIVINGPKTESESVTKWSDDIYYDNNQRRAYLVRPEVGQVKNSPEEDFLPADFPASEVYKYKDKWK